MRLKSIPSFPARAAGLLLLAAVPLVSMAEEDPDNLPVGNILYTVGTTFEHAGRSHAYLLWSPTDEDLLRRRSYSVWSKPGRPGDPGTYRPESWIEVRTDPLVLEGILRRSERLGQDLDKLEGVIDGLFDVFTPGSGLSRSEKLSAILQGAQQDSELYHDLLLLARLYPAVSVCLGAAWTGPIDGPRTYELRMAAPGDGPHAPDAVRRVVGRVTLDPAAYLPLPAPGPPVDVPLKKVLPDGTIVKNLKAPRADRNLRLRWGTPDDLRQRALLQFGYHVWRVDPEFFDREDMGMGLGADNLPFYAEAYPDKVRRITSNPVLIDRMMTGPEAADWDADPDTWFVVDDNGRFESGGVPFDDGDVFQYLVTAVDVLGRPGLPSHASRQQVFRTMSPNPPRNLSVRDLVTHPTPTTTRQVFGLSWQAPREVADAPVTRFDVFRWVESDDPLTPDGPTVSPELWDPPVRVGSVTALPGVEWYEFEDDSLGVPPPASELDKPWWFTVQAVSEGVVLEIPSPHGPPASGVLRDRSAPAGQVQAVVVITESAPRIQVDSVGPGGSLPTADPGFLHARIRLARGADSAIDGADFYYRVDEPGPAGSTEDTPLGPAPVGASYLGSVRFHDPAATGIVADYRIALPDAGSHTVTFLLRSRDVHGRRSGFVSEMVSSGPDDERRELVVSAPHSYRQTPVPRGSSRYRHVSRRVGQAENDDPIVALEGGPEDVEVWKIYRRIDLGPAVLVAENTEPPPVQIPVGGVAANAGDVSYFVQVADASGNAGPMEELGHFGLSPAEPPPQPMLLPLEALAGQQASLSWACAPHGVERFHVGVALLGGIAADRISEDLGEVFEHRAGVPVKLGGETVELDFQLYDTGPLLGNTSPEHEVTVDLEAGGTYLFFVEALAAGGERGPTSNVVDFGWLEPVDGGPDAVWPARPAPRINTTFLTPKAGEGGITIGHLSEFATVTTVDDTVRIKPPVDLHANLLRETSGPHQDGRPQRRLLPCVVYRYQLPNGAFPTVSGDVVQVTPLLREIAARNETIGGEVHTVVYDPYFNFTQSTKEIRLTVPQPIMSQASYRYLMVLFNDDGEIDSVVPTTEFTNIIN